MALRSSTTIRFARRALCAGVATAFGASVLAQIPPFKAIHGSASANAASDVITTVNGAGTRHSALDWQAFGVAAGKSLFFAQPDALSTSINRVLGGNPSLIAGRLGSNGRLVLVNPAGITVGPGAAVDTAGFTASTLAMSRDNAIAGRLLFGGAGGGRDGDGDDFKRKGGRGLHVEGQVLAHNGDVVLVGPEVGTGPHAVVQASNGDVVLAAGRSVEITGRGLEGIRMQLRAPNGHAVNLGTLRGDAVAIFAGHLHHSGLIQANSASAAGGRVVLQAGDEGEVAGRIEATTTAHGGSVFVTAGKLKLKTSTAIDVSHAAGGGEILVGGGLDGRDARLPNARDVDVEKGVQLRADATLSGPGGTVVAWSDGELRFGGGILARGAGGALGGLVEVSARGRIRYEGTVDVNGDGSRGGPAPKSNSGKGNSGAPGDGADSGHGPPGSGSSGSGSSGPGSSGSGSSGSSGSSGPGSSGSSGSSSSAAAGALDSSRGRVPIIPLIGQAADVRSSAQRPADATAAFLVTASQLLDPGQDALASLLQPARTASSSDARVVGAGPADRDGKRKGELIVTGAQCRTGS